jgi:hypothetical protein
MALFKYADISGKGAGAQSKAVSSGKSGPPSSLRRIDDVSKRLHSLQQGESMHFVSEGIWSMHEMLEEMLRKSGPADVYITTWTITEFPVRRIVMLKEEGLIKSLSCLLDYRIRGRKPGPFQLLQFNASRLALAKCHAKVAIAVNEEWALSCVGSANLSRNPRFEAGVVSASRADAEFHKSWIDGAIEKYAK